MSKVVIAFCLVFLVAGCSSTQEQSSAGVEERNIFDDQQAEEQAEFDRAQAEQAEKDAQIRREQDELNRQLEEQRQRELADAEIEVEEPDIRPLTDSSLADGDGQMQDDPWMRLGEPGSSLAQRSIYYEFDRYDIQDEYIALIEAHANFLLENPELKIIVQGNCDDRGSREYNLALGQRRAESVKRALALLGVGEEQIESVSFGAEKPVAFGQDEESWAQNRRSDIVYVGEPK
jgi:peptidoglycan-associated lipoprotein